MRIISLFLFLLIPITIILGGILFVVLFDVVADPRIPANIVTSILTCKNRKPVASPQQTNPPAAPTVPPVTEAVAPPVAKESSSDKKHCGFQIVKENQDYNITTDVAEGMSIPDNIPRNEHYESCEDLDADVDDDWEDDDTDKETEVERRARLYEEYEMELAEREREEEEEREQLEMLDDMIMDMYLL